MTKELSPAELRAALQQSAVIIQKLKKELAGYSEPIAVIGMACRFPGADSPEAFWDLLRQGVDRVGPTPATRWDVDAYYDPVPATPGKTYVREGAFLAQIDGFDAHFFGISPREAASMDPQHRLLLEVSWEALERAGQSPAALQNSQTGVFVGVTPNEYALRAGEIERTETYISMGNYTVFAVGRLSYVLGLQGPNLAIDTACSASLIGVHLACESLRTGSSDLALAGGAHLLIAPEGFVSMSQLQALAPDGRCKTFDAAANGFGRGEGCGMVVLKRLTDALADRDPILAVIRGSATNHDGPSSGLTVPSVSAQTALIRRALANGKVAPHEVSYVDAHGTGTSLGDPIEVRALAAVFGERTTPLLIGSVKTNIGHLEEAAGVAGLIKVILAMQHQELPPHLHLRRPNPHIDWASLPLRIPTERTPWPAGRKIAGVSSFGLGGSNGHVVIEEAPTVADVANPKERPWHLLTLSAKSDQALRDLAQRYCALLQAQPTVALGDLCYTAYTGRSHFAHRLSLTASSVADLHAALTTYLNGAAAPGIHCAVTPEYQAAPKIAFLFTGQGSQYVGMGRELYADEAVFRGVIDRCEQVLAECLGRSLLELLYPATAPDHDDLLTSHPCGQAANFAIECALADLWRAWGVVPDVVLGHSLGDFAAAYSAGVLTLEDGLRLVTLRGRLMEQATGSMVAVMAAEVEVLPCLAGLADVTIGVINGSRSLVIAGGEANVALATNRLQAAGFKTRRLDIPVAAHSPLLDPVLDDFEAAVRQVKLSPPQRPVVSSMTGKLVTHELTDPRYWRNHLRNTVRFADGLQTLHAQGINIYLEIGPKPTLLGLVGQGDDKVTSDKVTTAHLVTPSPPHLVMLPSLRSDRSAWQQMVTSLGALYAQGVTPDWQGFEQGYRRCKVVLPTYPFQRQRYWLTSAPVAPVRQEHRGTAGADGRLRPLIDKRTRLPHQGQTLFEKSLGVATLPWLADHCVFGDVVAPGAAHLALALSGADLLTPGAPCTLRDVVFPQPLLLPGGEERTVQLVVETLLAPVVAPDTTPIPFQLSSFAEAAIATDAPLTHASGQMIFSAAPAPSVDLAALQAQCPLALAPTALYAALDDHQIQLGPHFRWLADLWLGEGGEALARLQPPATLGSTAGYPLFPALLDACFQLTAAGRLGPDQPPGERPTFMPFALDELRFYGATTAAELWCHARQVADQRWDLLLCTAAGQVIAQLLGFQVRAATANPASRLRTDWLYQLDWEACPLAAPVGPGQQPAAWLVVGDSNGVGAALRNRLAADGAAVYRTRSDLPLLPTQVGAVGVVYLQDAAATVAGDDLPIQTRQACGDLLALVQQVAAMTMPTRFWVVTAPQTVVAGETVALSPVAGALWGLARTIAQEAPHLHTVCIDLPPAAAADNALVIQTELLAGWRTDDSQPEAQIAYRQGVRYGARLTRRQSPAPQVGQLDATAVYLITGGLGGLGLQVAQTLAKLGAKQLVLTGRRGITTAAAQATLADLTAQGVTAQVVPADISDRAAVQQVLDACAALGPLRGIVHAAGVLNDGILQQQSAARLDTVMRPKVDGGWHLHCLTAGLALDFFVSFSSAAALLGSAGQSNYAAANAFLDTLMQQRAQAGQPGLSINWGPWAEVGLAAAWQNRLHNQGLAMIQPAQGQMLCQHLLTTAQGAVAVLPLACHAVGGQRPSGASALFARLWPPEAAPARRGPAFDWLAWQRATPDQRRTMAEDYLRAAVARVTGLPTEQVDHQQSLLALGLDSLMAVELRNWITQDAGVTLPLSLFLEEQALTTLADELVSQLEELPASTLLSRSVNDQWMAASGERAAVPTSNGERGIDNRHNAMATAWRNAALPTTDPYLELAGMELAGVELEGEL